MATNPKIPEERHVHPKFKLQPRTRVPWGPVTLILAAILLIGLIVYLPRAPRAARTPTAGELPPQPTGNQLQLTNLKIVPAPAGNTVALDAQMLNNGNTEVTGVAVDATFEDASGAGVGTVQAKVMGIQGGTGGITEELTKTPIKPGQTRAVRMVFDQVPQGWNHQLPKLTVAAVTAAGNPKENRANTASPSQPGKPPQ